MDLGGDGSLDHGHDPINHIVLEECRDYGLLDTALL